MRDFTSIALRALACLVLVAFLGLALLPTRVTRTVIAQDNSGIRPEIPVIPPGSGLSPDESTFRHTWFCARA